MPKWTDPETGKEYNIGYMMKQTVLDKLIKTVARGAPDYVACQVAGIQFQTLLDWRYKAKYGGEEASGYRYWVMRIEQARGDYAMKHLNAVSTAALNGSWQAAAWILERRFPEEFSQLTRNRIETHDLQPGEENGQGNTKVELDVTQLSPQELMVLHGILKRVQSGVDETKVIDVEPTRPQLAQQD